MTSKHNSLGSLLGWRPSSPSGKNPLQQASAHKSARSLFRLGQVAIGTVYALVGVTTLSFTLGYGGRIEDAEGALARLERQPFGNVLLFMLGIGLLGYVLWRFAQAFANIEHRAPRMKEYFTRAGFAISGFVYLSLATMAIRSAYQDRVSQQGQRSEAYWSSQLMELPAGRWILALIGLIIMGVGIHQVYRGLSERFMKECATQQMSAQDRQRLRLAGKIGLPARGCTFGIMGFLIFLAGWHANAAEAKGTKGAFAAILSQPYGKTLLGLIAAGFIAYAVYCFYAARYRKFA